MTIQRQDALIAAAATAFVQANVLLSDARSLSVAVAALALTVPLAWRHRAPFAVVVAVMAGLVVSVALVRPEIEQLDVALLPELVAVYSVAAYAARNRAVAGLVVSVAAAWYWLGIGDITFAIVVFGAVWIAGFLLRRRAAESAHAAIQDERARIARELHDVVAHAVSVMVVQAGAERVALGDDRSETSAVLRSIEATGRQALVEMRRLLGVLRQDEPVALAPAPSLDHLEALVDGVREAGLPVELELHGERVELPPGVDVSAYRIVQEALTNALKHAGPARARVLVRYAPHALELEVADDGRGDGGGAGHGLAGMRERAGVLGGSLTAGGGKNRGYVVRASLPL